MNPAIEPAMEAICLKAMALKPKDRYHSPRELADTIEVLLASDYEKLDCPTIFGSTRGAMTLSRNTAVLVTGIAILSGSAGFVRAEVKRAKRSRSS